MESAPPSRFARTVQDAKTRISEIAPEELKARLDSRGAPVVVDVREADEYRKEHAAGAIHLSKGVLERDIEKVVPDPSAPVVVYCGGGSRGALAADALGRMGYTNVSSLRGGLRRWRELGLSTESGPPEAKKS
ncbi:MAG: rhodanese-like domain-containing protein [Acidobacteriota bacterium]